MVRKNKKSSKKSPHNGEAAKGEIINDGAEKTVHERDAVREPVAKKQKINWVNGGGGAAENEDDKSAPSEKPERVLPRGPIEDRSKGDAGIDDDDDSDRDDDSSESSEDDDLVLEGVLERIDYDSSESDDSEEDEILMKAAASEPKRPTIRKKKEKKKKKKSSDSSDEDSVSDLNVDFIFCDMDEKFFHGLKTQIHTNNSIHTPHSSALADLMIENVSVGTVIATENDDEHNVYGYASVLNVTTNQSAPCVQSMKEEYLRHCPEENRKELETVLSGKTARPAGFLLHDRMINLPLEITEVLHKQLILDMDWAVKNAEGGAEERKSLDFGVFVRLAPCTKSKAGALLYKYFDDEVFATNSEFNYTFDAPKSFGQEDKKFCTVIVMTKTGHRESMEELKKLIHG